MYKIKPQITKQELLAMSVDWEEEPGAIVLYGVDRTDEWVKFYFREDDNLPDEIDVAALNNTVNLMDGESMTWERLAFSIWLCFSPWENEPILQLVRQLPITVFVKSETKCKSNK